MISFERYYIVDILWDLAEYEYMNIYINDIWLYYEIAEKLSFSIFKYVIKNKILKNFFLYI